MTKKQKEERAVEAIISGLLRGFTKKDWQKVFAKMDKGMPKRSKPGKPVVWGKRCA